jgi:hypothetical protein
MGLERNLDAEYDKRENQGADNGSDDDDGKTGAGAGQSGDAASSATAPTTQSRRLHADRRLPLLQASKKIKDQKSFLRAMAEDRERMRPELPTREDLRTQQHVRTVYGKNTRSVVRQRWDAMRAAAPQIDATLTRRSVQRSRPTTPRTRSRVRGRMRTMVSAVAVLRLMKFEAQLHAEEDQFTPGGFIRKVDATDATKAQHPEALPRL